VKVTPNQETTAPRPIFALLYGRMGGKPLKACLAGSKPIFHGGLRNSMALDETTPKTVPLPSEERANDFSSRNDP
jgi:hypothetical protein